MNYITLKKLVQKHCDLYYDQSVPSISDADFDALYDKLEEVEKAQGWQAIDSPTVKVGGIAGKVQHPFKLYSLQKVYNVEEVPSNFSIETPKIDGTNITLVYKLGRLSAALTRGNGEMGDNVLHLVKHIKNIPKTIKSSWKIVVINGECVTNKKVDNFRNYVSGALGLKSEEEFKNRDILFIAHDLLGVTLDYTTRMKLVSAMGITTVMDPIADKYPQDGRVFRIDSYNKSVTLGYTSKYPKFAIALKEREVTVAISTLQEVIWTVGRTGTVNPTGIISPVVLDDATITRVTLHNIRIIEDNSLGIGDTIKVERAGGVIPKFLEVIEHSKHNIKISKIDAEKQVNLELVRKGPTLVVKNSSDVNQAKVVEHFVKTMEIKGLGPASINKMNITHISQLYSSNTKWDQLGANGQKILQEVYKSRLKPYSIVLAALGIKGVGRAAAKVIVNKIPAFIHLKDIEYTEVKGVGPATINSILSFLEDNEDWVLKLPLQLRQELLISDILDEPTKKVCITGKMDITRKELSDELEILGYKTTSTVTKDCYALITGGDTSSSKYKKAIAQGTTIVDYWSRKKEVLTGKF